MIAWLQAKAAKWLAIVGGLIVAIGTTALVFWRKGAKQQAGTDAAKDAKAEVESAQAVQQAAQARVEVENETAKLPDAPAQELETADPGTAAGQLRTDGWLRDDKPTVSDDDPS